jgi:hypothetical protein
MAEPATDLLTMVLPVSTMKMSLRPSTRSLGLLLMV